LCSIHFQKDPSEDNLLANSLFGDGAAAVVVGNSKSERYISMDHFKSEIFPDGEDDMAWSIGNTGFEMRLSTYVPDIIRVGIRDLVEKLKNESATKEIHQYAIHPGGKKILDVVKDKLELEKDDLAASYQILREYGNMSSPTILFVMHRILYAASVAKDQKMLSLAFGPGLTIESAMMTLHHA
jgi:predicted naringenin-chalcone synthase